MNEDILRVLGWGIFAAISWYVPLNAYTDRTIQQTDIVNGNWPPLLIAYIVWYVPVVFLLIGGVLFDSFMICSSIVLISILWVYIGHSWIKGRVIKNT